jgi:hypothetical protein
MPRDSPRHIGDIAHLYLSRARVRRGASRLLVAGVSPDAIPGFHAANLALTAAAGAMTVRLVEASGLPVSAGCFLGLDPTCWVPDGRAPAAAVSAFARVSFARSSGPGHPVPAMPGENGGGDVLEIVHAPPWDSGDAHVRAVADAAAEPTVLVYFAERDGSPRPWLEWRDVTNVAARVAFVTRAGTEPGNPECAGVITRWSAALTDPLPAVLRDPGSRLARQYRDVLTNLLADTRAVARDRAGHPHATTPIRSF